MYFRSWQTCVVLGYTNLWRLFWLYTILNGILIRTPTVWGPRSLLGLVYRPGCGLNPCLWIETCTPRPLHCLLVILSGIKRSSVKRMRRASLRPIFLIYPYQQLINTTMSLVLVPNLKHTFRSTTILIPFKKKKKRRFSPGEKYWIDTLLKTSYTKFSSWSIVSSKILYMEFLLKYYHLRFPYTFIFLSSYLRIHEWWTEVITGWVRVIPFIIYNFLLFWIDKLYNYITLIWL